MTLDEARQTRDWLKVLEDAKEWLDTFTQPDFDKPFVAITQFEGRVNPEGFGGGGNISWDGALVMPTPLAIDLMKWLIGRAEAALRLPDYQRRDG